MRGVLVGEPISSSGLAMKTRRPTGSHSATGADAASGERDAASGERASATARSAAMA